MHTCTDIQVIVLAHGGQQATFDRNLWSWRRLDPSFLAICPQDDPIRVPSGIPLRRVGHQGHIGAAASRRLKEILHIALERPAERTIIFEYDSLCLAPQLPMTILRGPDAFYSAKFNSGDRNFISPWYLFPPWCMGQETLRAISAEMDRHPDPIERGFHDRMMGFAAWKAGVKVVNTLATNDAFGANKVDQNRIFMDLMDSIGHGATLIHHGLKL